MQKSYKELEIILSDFSCNKHCPYCTAKITKWPQVEDDLDALELNVVEMKKEGYTFDFLTIGGNGEPTLYPYRKLKHIIDMFKDYNIPIKRVLTSGNIFKEENKEKFELFNNSDYLFEVTTTSFSTENDMKTLGYSNDYFHSDLFKQAKRVRVNFVMLKENYNTFISEIKSFINTYPNVETVAIKFLNVNTKTDLVDNSLSEWIVENGLGKENKEFVKIALDNEFVYQGSKYDTFSWLYNNKEIYFSYKSTDYGKYDLVWYGNRFVDYSLNTKEIERQTKRIYMAMHFEVDKHEDKISLERDVRDKLLRETGSGLLDYSSNCYVSLKGFGDFHYVGPFYNEKASDGLLTSSDCEVVVLQEKKLIDLCDVFLVYLDDNVSPGSISELMYAVLKNKDIIILYKNESDISYSLKSSNWFPIVFSLQLSNKIQIKSIDDLKIELSMSLFYFYMNSETHIYNI